MSLVQRSVISRNLRLRALILASGALSANAFAGVIASTNFETTGSIPAITWTPTLQLGAGVPASASSYAALNNNGTVDVRTNTGAKPVPVGVKTKSMSMNADFSGVSGTATSWSATMKTPLLDIVNYESYLGKLDLSFDLSANRVCPVKVRIESFNSSNASTGYREATILPVAINATYRYCIDLNTMAAGPSDFKPVGADGDKIQISVILTGTSTDGQSWPRGAGNVYNQVYVDNITYTSPAYYVSQNGGGTGATQASPAKLTDIIKIAQPGDVILLNGDTYTGTLDIYHASGTPSRWITLRSNPTSTAPIFRSNSWNAIKIFANTGYINLQGLVIRGYLNDATQIAAGLTLANATADGEKLNTTATQPNNPAYTVFSGTGRNVYSGAGKFNVNGIFLEGRKKMVPSGSTYVMQDALDHEGVHHVRVADCLIYENTAAGIASAKADYFIIENNVVYDNQRYSRYGGSGISSLIACDFDGGNGYKIFVNGNISHNNGGWVRWGPSHSVDPTTGRNTVVLNFSDGNGIIIDTHNDFAYSGRTLVQNNLVYENSGSGIHALKSDRVDIVNNTAFRNSKPNGAPSSVVSRRWVQQPVPGSNPPVYTLAANPPYATYIDQPQSWYTDGGESQNYGQIFAQGAGSDVRIRNNIIWASAGQRTNEGMPAGETNISYDNNLFGRDGGNVAAGTSTTGFTTFNYNILESTGVASNVFANVTNPATTSTWLHLKTSAPVSPAINAGNIWAPGAPRNDLNGIRRPRGSNTDIGAFEDL